MEDDFLKSREATLANGDHVSLFDAARHQSRLQAQLGSDEDEWEAVYYLREVCLDRPIEKAPERFLIQKGVATFRRHEKS